MKIIIDLYFMFTLRIVMNDWSGINDDDSGFDGTYFDRVVRTVHFDAVQARIDAREKAIAQLEREKKWKD